MKHTAECFAAHLGPWAIEPQFLSQAVSAIKSGLWNPQAFNKPKALSENNDGTIKLLYDVTPSGSAIISINGAMMKSRSKYGGASTIELRQALRDAAFNKEIGAILLVVDSPGGSVAGTQALADEIRAVDAIKPVIAHVEDLAASAGYWAASQARKINANRSALVGSLGVYGVLEDTSGAAKAEGVTVHVVSTGKHKGAFVDGAPITAEQISEYQRVIDGFNVIFQQAVSSGRGLHQEKIDALFDGRVHLASDAKNLGLIDEIKSIEDSINEVDALAKSRNGSAKRRLDLARARVK